MCPLSPLHPLYLRKDRTKKSSGLKSSGLHFQGRSYEPLSKLLVSPFNNPYSSPLYNPLYNHPLRSLDYSSYGNYPHTVVQTMSESMPVTRFNALGLWVKSHMLNLKPLIETLHPSTSQAPTPCTLRSLPGHGGPHLLGTPYEVESRTPYSPSLEDHCSIYTFGIQVLLYQL